MSTVDPLVGLLLAHRDDSEMASERLGEVWVSCSCGDTALWGGDNPWPTTPISSTEAEQLHAAHLAAVIREAGIR